MKKILATLAFSLSVFGLTALAHAFTPTVNLVSPTGTHETQIPATFSVTLEVALNNNNGNCITDGINSIVVTAQHENDASPTTIHTSAENFVLPKECPTTYTFDWTVIKAGTYTLTVTLKHGNDTGTTDESVEFVLLAVEYPAPPAVANAYIKDTYTKLTGGVRGCVISEIAHNAKYPEAYGPKPGPYNVDAIKADVDALLGVGGACVGVKGK